MLRELLSIFRDDNPLRSMAGQFSRMPDMTHQMTLSAGEIFFTMRPAPEDRRRILEADVEVNRLQRTIRKEIVAHLSVQGHGADLPYCLLLMSLVQDVERLGDYAKNVAEIVDLRSEPLPGDELAGELQAIRRGVEAGFRGAAHAFSTSDRSAAATLIREGRTLAHRCHDLIARLSRGPHDANTSTVLVPGARYYKRIGGHLLNLLTSVVMPLHKLDYFDEDEVGH